MAGRIAFGLCIILLLASCAGNAEDKYKSQVLGVESKAFALVGPVEATHAKFTSATEYKATSNKDLLKYIKGTLRPLVQSASDESLAADNKCYALEQSVKKSLLPEGIKKKLAAFVFEMSQYFYCRWQAYDTTLDSFDAEKSGNRILSMKRMQKATEFMERSTKAEFEVCAEMLKLNQSVGIPDAETYKIMGTNAPAAQK